MRSWMKKGLALVLTVAMVVHQVLPVFLPCSLRRLEKAALP